jgi:hypothetical protein
MWEKYYKENFGLIRQHDIKKTFLEKQIESTMIILSNWNEAKHALVSVNTYINVSSKLMMEFVNLLKTLACGFLMALKFGNL